MTAIQYSRYQQHGGFKMWSRGFGPSTLPLQEGKSELRLQIERNLLMLVYQARLRRQSYHRGADFSGSEAALAVVEGAE